MTVVKTTRCTATKAVQRITCERKKRFSFNKLTLYLVFDYLLHDLCVTWNRLNLCQAHPLCFILRVLKALKKSYLGTCGAITRDAAASNENRADKLTLEFRSFWGLFEVEISTSFRVKKTTEFSKIAMYRVS